MLNSAAFKSEVHSMLLEDGWSAEAAQFISERSLNKRIYAALNRMLRKSGQQPYPLQRTKKAAISISLRWDVWERDDFRCVQCGARKFLSVDHIIPESKGGKLEMNNLQTLCISCNSKKGSK